MTDQQLERELRAWFHAAVPASETAPGALRAGVAWIPRTVEAPRLVVSRRRLGLLAVAAALAATLIGLAIAGPGGWLPTRSPLASAPASELPSPNPTSARASSWTDVGEMQIGRKWHTATLLADGRVLVAGGESGLEQDAFSSAELFDPATGTWSETGSMSTARYLHTATLLPNGKVLVAGGTSFRPSFVQKNTSFDTPSAELYDPATGSWTKTGSLAVGRSFHTATLLEDGRVLVVGGAAETEIYDPATGRWAESAPLQPGRDQQTATLLRDGRVLIATGFNEATQSQNAYAMRAADLFDPGTGAFETTGRLAHRRVQAAAVPLDDGDVMLAGGFDPYSDTFAAPTAAEVYHPATGTWTSTGDVITSRFDVTLVKLSDGSILLIGGIHPFGRQEQDYQVLASVESYSPATGTWSLEDPLSTGRFGHAATLLRDGTVLVTGGAALQNGPSLASAELFDPGASR